LFCCVIKTNDKVIATVLFKQRCDFDYFSVSAPYFMFGQSKLRSREKVTFIETVVKNELNETFQHLSDIALQVRRKSDEEN
jgi:hypothetical protein